MMESALKLMLSKENWLLVGSKRQNSREIFKVFEVVAIGSVQFNGTLSAGISTIKLILFPFTVSC